MSTGEAVLQNSGSVLYNNYAENFKKILYKIFVVGRFFIVKLPAKILELYLKLTDFTTNAFQGILYIYIKVSSQKRHVL